MNRWAQMLAALGSVANASPAAAQVEDWGTGAVALYQLGDVWGRETVDGQLLSQGDPIVRRAALAVAYYRGATAFYLGQFAGQYIMATNHHVQPTLRCDMLPAYFPVMDASLRCERVYGSWPDIDLALFAVQVSQTQQAALAEIGLPFAFDASVYPGQKLLTLGFGRANNPARLLQLSRDADCVVMSARDVFRLINDPDAINPGAYPTWAFANACDLSHGDSGSPVLDRLDGAVLGLLYTGGIPKPPEVQSSAYLTHMRESQDPQVWRDLSYAVPARKIYEYLSTLLTTSLLDPDTRSVLAAIVSSRF